MEIVKKFLSWVLALLPTSPFTEFIDGLETLPYLSWANWFVPVGEIVTIGMSWLGAVALFYLYSIILRWIRAIE